MRNDFPFRSPYDDPRLRAEAERLRDLEGKLAAAGDPPPEAGSLLDPGAGQAVAGAALRRAVRWQRMAFEKVLRVVGREIAGEHMDEYRALARDVALGLCRLARAQQAERDFRMAALQKDIDVSPWKPFTGYPVNLDPGAPFGTLWRVLRQAVNAGHVTAEELAAELPGVDVPAMLRGERP
ncbi:MAG TPA: hypothetical protein ENK19_08600 [Acidobacteria bacterium]|nr:hypothetical protein [Acidobacteriota bacterium]